MLKAWPEDETYVSPWSEGQEMIGKLVDVGSTRDEIVVDVVGRDAAVLLLNGRFVRGLPPPPGMS